MIWKWLSAFLRGFIPGFISGWWSRRRTIQDDKSEGAADQRKADKVADDAIVREAEGMATGIVEAPDGDIDRRLDRWRKSGGV
jgi:hypothetical protein